MAWRSKGGTLLNIHLFKYWLTCNLICLPQSASSILLNLYREAAKFLLNQNKPKQAVKYLEKIIEKKGKNAKITSMLINAYSQFDTTKAQR